MGSAREATTPVKPHQNISSLLLYQTLQRRSRKANPTHHPTSIHGGEPLDGSAMDIE
jgi:hypothetical protein